MAMAGDDTILSGNRMEEEQNKAYYFLDRVPESPEGLPVGENFPDLPVVLPAGETGPTADLPVV